MVNYKDIKDDFYDSQAESLNPLRRWFHQTRHRLIGDLVQTYYRDGTILDLGCGNCIWNAQRQLPVIGIDISKGMLEFAKGRGNISDAIETSLHHLAIRDGSISIAVITEVLEHMEFYNQVLADINRILKPGGLVIASVPFDTRFSMWQPLFALQCLVQGYIRGDSYYKKKCGHINHFSPRSFQHALLRNNFISIDELYMKRFTILIVGKKVEEVHHAVHTEVYQGIGKV